MQNQDPLSPLEPEELTAQLATFSSLEQLTAINAQLENLIRATEQTTTTALPGLIGKDVTFDGGEIGIQAGRAPTIDFELEGEAEAVTATIRDQSGSLVRTIDLGALGPGEHTFTFDGKDRSGAVVADGTYDVLIAATPTGAEVPTVLSLRARGTVDGVDFASDVPALLVGGRRIGLGEVLQVREPGETNA